MFQIGDIIQVASYEDVIGYIIYIFSLVIKIMDKCYKLIFYFQFI
jgi:hypothetical protein